MRRLTFILSLLLLLLQSSLALELADKLGPQPAGLQVEESTLLNLVEESRLRVELGRGDPYHTLLETGQPWEDGQIGQSDIQLMYVNERGFPLYQSITNLNAARTISTDEVWTGGATGLDLDGATITGNHLGIWDAGGVRLTHTEFNGRVVQIDSPAATHWHSTHCAGTLISAGEDASSKGMAHEAERLIAFDWDDDLAEMALSALFGMRASSHSYGFVTGWNQDNTGTWAWYGDSTLSTNEDHRFGFYMDESAEYDNLAHAAPLLLITKSAGNDRNDAGPGAGGWHWHFQQANSVWIWINDNHAADGGATGYDTMGPKACAKNILTVGAVNDIPGGYANPGNVVLTAFSSWGPTDDGRIKPDLVANGNFVYSTDDSNDTSYTNSSGTSMSTPSVAASAALLQEHYEDTVGDFPRAATIKAIILHTCDEAGAADGPDYQHGWGLMNTRSAAELISDIPNDDTYVIETTLEHGETDTYHFDVSGWDDVSMTLVWMDPEGTPVADAVDPGTLMLVNDLDMDAVQGGSTFRPWILNPANPGNAATTGDNDRDNVEKIEIDSNQLSGGILTVNIDHEGAISEGPQRYSLIVTGIVREHASIVYVPADYGTIQAAIDASLSGDSIYVSPGIYSGIGNRDLDFGGKDLLLQSLSGPELTIINAGGSAASNHRAFHFHSGETSSAVLDGFTITGAYQDGSYPEDQGGGIYVFGCDPTIRNCQFGDNYALNGGALKLRNSNSVVENCLFSDNSGTWGGAICTAEGTPSIASCTFDSNSATVGGGVYLGYDTAWASIDDCTFYGNSSAQAGSGAVHLYYATASLYRNIISYSSDGSSIAINDESGSVFLSCNCLYGNADGDWNSSIGSFYLVNGNISEDPLFCDPESGDLGLANLSPCLPANNSCGVQMGAEGSDCVASYPDISVSPVSFDFTLAEGESESQVLEISNLPADALSLDWEIGEQEEWSFLFRSGSSAERSLLEERVRNLRQYAKLELQRGELDPRGGQAPLRSGGQDEYGYGWIDSDDIGGPAFDWFDIVAVGNAHAIGDEDGVNVALPFNFPFYGIDMNFVNIGDNGCLTFDAAYAVWGNDPIPDPYHEPHNFIAPFWDDLDPGVGGSIHSFHDEDNGRFIVQYTDVPRYNGPEVYTFQVMLETDGSILYQYLAMDSNLLDSASIGIENGDGLDGLQIVFNSDYLHDDLAVRIFPDQDCAWITASPLTGATPASGTSTVSIMADASGMTEGSHDCTLLVFSNDPDTHIVSVDVTLTVPHTPVVIHVDPLGDDATGDGSEGNPFASIQHSVDVAVDADTIQAAAGTYTGVGNRGIEFLGKNLVLRSAAGPEDTEIDCEGADRAFYLHSAESQETLIDGFRLVNGYANDAETPGTGRGGSILLGSGASPTFMNCVISGNVAERSGGGVFVGTSCDPVFVSCTFSGNATELYGGGGVEVYNNAFAIFERCILWDNCAGGSGDEYYGTGSSSASFSCSSVREDGIYSPGSIVWETENLNADPLFCSSESCNDAPTEAGSYRLAANSPCLPDANACGVLIGALNEGCGEVDAPETPAGPLSCRLYSNSPNPFNPKTEIRFDLPDTRLVRLEIYDLLGRKVRSLLNSTMETGEHRVEWDGRNSQGEMQPSGVYFYRISAGDFRETRKMMMLK
ncbi:MAG: S8 family serine peptidase [Candidatus Krumholzibacteria bacterium]|jgi:hypothetical protein|nr:S8 family serine peptidase [Candidatus Krumholzibacteria bacterium]